MTHLRIEQNNIQENVSSDVIEKLYELATSGDLDQNSNLAGNLHTTATYQEYIDALTTAYQDLYITATNIYLSFADPEVTRILASQFSGDGVGITQSELYSITTLNNVFQNNTTIEYFDDFNKLSGISQLKTQEFSGCTNLKSINLNHITSSEVYGGMNENYTFKNCTSLTKIIAPNLTNISYQEFNNCTSLRIIIAKNLTNAGRPSGMFGNDSQLKAVIFPKLNAQFNNTLQFGGDYYHPNPLIGGASNLVVIEICDLNSVNKNAMRNNTALRCVVIHGNTIPTLNEWSSGSLFTQWFPNNSITIYVKDSLLSTYQSDTTWSEYYSTYIKGISEYNPADYLDSDLLQIYNEAMGTSYAAS